MEIDHKGDTCYLGVTYARKIMLKGVIKARLDATDTMRSGIMRGIVRKYTQENYQYKHLIRFVTKEVEYQLE